MSYRAGNADIEWPAELRPEDWRDMPDPDGGDEALENDADRPAQQYVIDMLGFDPDEEDYPTANSLALHLHHAKHDQKTHGRGKRGLQQVGGMSKEELLAAGRSAGKVKKHGMENEESMRSLEVDGVRILYNEDTADAALATIKNASEVHPKLWKQNEEIVFSSQPDKKAEQIAKANGLGEFVSNASGGDGTVVVYGHTSMTADSLAHESAHNLAFNVYGKGAPSLFTPGGDVDRKGFAVGRKVKMQGMKQRVSNAVTKYGQWSPEEDFAEYVTAYNAIVINGNKKYREATLAKLKKRPVAFAAVSKMLGD